MSRKWYSIQDNIKANAAEISIYDEIGDYGVSLEQFTSDFNAVRDRDSVKLYLNSPGGEVFTGLGIYNLLSKISNKLTIEVTGLAASIASIILLSADERIIDNGSFVMIHDPFMTTAGTSEEIRKDADTLDKIKDQIVNIYIDRTGLSKEEIVSLMSDETWLDCVQAVEKGFATQANTRVQAATALYNLTGRGFNKVPKSLVRPNITIKNLSVREIEATLRDVGFSNSEATTLASKLGTEKIDERDSRSPDDEDVLNQLRNLLINK
jgi:ATP-dependent Clp endopeptidase proteolytic subunit ClpP